MVFGLSSLIVVSLNVTFEVSPDTVMFFDGIKAN